MADLKVKVGVDKSGFTTGLASMENSVKGFGMKVGGILAGAFAFDKIIQGFSNAIDKGDQLQDLANRFGLAASSLQQIGNAASVSGAGIEEVASAMNKLAVNAGKAIGGDDAMKQAFADIGLTVQQLKEMSPQDIFFALSEAIKNTSNPLEAFAKAQAVAGKSVGALMEMMRMGSSSIQELGNSMGVFSNETISKLSAASDALKAFQLLNTLVFGNVVSKIMDAVEAYARFAAIRPLIQFFDQIKASTTGSGKSVRDIEGGSGGVSAAADKAFEASERAAARHELRLIEAQISGKEEAEKMKQAIEEKYAQKSLERAQRLEEEKANQMDDRTERLAQINKARGNASDFDPREALMQRFGLGNQLRDIPSSTEAQRTQPVRLENPPNLQGVLDKLDRLIANAGVFS